MDRWDTYTHDALLTPTDQEHGLQDGDHFVSSHVIGTPDAFDLRYLMPPVRDQGRQGSCVAQACAAMKEYQEQKDPLVRLPHGIHLSPQFVFDLRANRPAQGMTMPDAMEILKTRGICREETYPYGSSNDTSDIPKECYKEAKRYVIREYTRLFDVEAVRRAIVAYGPVAIVVPVYNTTARIWERRKRERLRGFHCMAIVGWKENGDFIVRNSCTFDIYVHRGIRCIPNIENSGLSTTGK